MAVTCKGRHLEKAHLVETASKGALTTVEHTVNA